MTVSGRRLAPTLRVLRDRRGSRGAPCIPPGRPSWAGEKRRGALVERDPERVVVKPADVDFLGVKRGLEVLHPCVVSVAVNRVEEFIVPERIAETFQPRGKRLREMVNALRDRPEALRPVVDGV